MGHNLHITFLGLLGLESSLGLEGKRDDGGGPEVNLEYLARQFLRGGSLSSLDEVGQSPQMGLSGCFH